MAKKTRKLKRKPLVPPLVASEEELAALENPTEADIEAAMAHWLQHAPPRAKGYIYARQVDPLEETDA